MTLPRLPDWVPSRESRSSGSVGGRADINRASRTRESRIRLAAREVVPVLYGHVMVEPGVFAVGRAGSRVVLGLLWGAGPLPHTPALTTRRGEPLPAGVEVDHVLGDAAQAPHPWLVDAIDGYADTLVAEVGGTSLPLAYSVVRLPPDVRPDIVGELVGPALYDPRVETTVAPALNPALWLLDWLSHPVYGAGQTVDWAGSILAVEACAEDLDGEPRRWGGLVIDRAGRNRSHVEALRTYAGCLVVQGDAGLRLVPRRPQAPAREIGPDQWIGSLSIERLSRDQRPTVVSIEYTDTRLRRWTRRTARAYAPGVLDGTTPWRESTVRLPGFQSHAVAKREAIERLNHASLATYRIQGICTDEALRDLPGDVVTITHPDGLSQQPVRIMAPRPVAPGRWQITAEPYSDALYSDTVETDPDPLSSHLPDPTEPPAPVTGMQVLEEVYQRQTGIFATRLRIHWDPTDWPYSTGYRVDVVQVDGSTETLAWRFETRQTEVVTGELQELETYRVDVVVVGELVAGEPAIETVIAQGKYLTPGDVPALHAGRIGADRVRLTWEPAIDVDIWRYEVRRAGLDWASASRVDRADELLLEVSGLPLGEHIFRVKAIDSVRQYSDQDTTVTVDLTPPPAPATLEGFEAGGTVRLHWSQVTGGWVESFELRYARPGEAWSAGRVLDVVRGQRLVTDAVPAGTWRFMVRSVDTAGNRSDTEAVRDITVTVDDAAFLIDQFGVGTGSSEQMTALRRRPEPDWQRMATDAGGVPADVFPAAMADYHQPLATYYGGPSTWLSETIDVGLVVTAQWQALVDYTVLAGQATAVLELSADGAAWEAVDLSAKTAGRYARVRITADGSVVVHEQAALRIDALAIEETGSGESVATGPTTITLDGQYQFVRTLTITPLGAESLNGVPDHIQLRGGDGPSEFDVYVFDAAGAQVAKPFLWTFKGV